MALRDFSLMMMVCVLWALSTVLSKIVISDWGVPPLFFAAGRFGLFLICVLPWLRRPPQRVGRVALAGFLVGGATFALVFLGLQRASPSSAAVVTQLGMPMTVGLSVALLGERLTPRRLVGVVLVSAGALVVMWDPRGFVISAGLLWVAGSALATALGSVLMKTIKSGVQSLQIQAWGALASVPVLALASLMLERGQVESVIAVGWKLVPALIFASVASSLIAHTVFFNLLRRYEANIISPLTVLGPILTIVFGVLITRDHFDLRMALGAVVAVAGVLVVAASPAAIRSVLAALRSRS